MFRVQTFNNIAPRGLAVFDDGDYRVGDDQSDPDAILLRSHKLLDMEFNSNLKAIARAGAGVNNIPVEECTNRGIVVFNTPGANANSVKELVLSGLLLSSRRIHQGLSWVDGLDPEADDVAKVVEKKKSEFAGPEIYDKTLGVIGLGAIGVLVSNAAAALGMNVVGFDPFISVESAWGLSRAVRRARSLEALLAESDYVTIHVPLNGDTRNFIDREKIFGMKKGARLLNFARGGLVDNSALLEAIDRDIISYYVTDFPEAEIIGNDRVLAIPHLGASTPEAEENCAVMAAQQLREFLEYGNVVNSVNFPECRMPARNYDRLLIANRNIPNMVGQVTKILADAKINILDLVNHHKDDVAYNIIDVDGKLSEETVPAIRNIEGIIMVRHLELAGR
ncbi:MAG: phosphoglycerate dehydrogenase [Spirochaetota bacterium]